MPEDKKFTKVLGDLRRELIEEGFSEDEAYSLVVEFSRRVTINKILVQD